MKEKALVMTLVRFNVRSLDVWGHGHADCKEHGCKCADREDWDCDCGFNVNNVFPLGSIEVEEAATDDEILSKLIEEGYLTEEARTLAEFDVPSDMGELFHVCQKTDGMPVLQLELARP